MQLFENLDAAKAAQVQVKSFSMIETHRGVAWSCSVFLKGKKLGMVSDEGNGGITRFTFPVSQQQEVMEALKASGYKLQLKLGETYITEPDGIESWVAFAVSQMGDEAAELNGYKRGTKTKTFVEKLSEPTFAAFKTPDTPQVREKLKQQLGDDLVGFLNDKILSY